MSARPVLRTLWPRCSGAPVRLGLENQFTSPWRSFASSSPRCAAPKQPKRAPRTVAQASAQPSPQPATPSIRATVPFKDAGNLGKLNIKVARLGEVLLFKAPKKRVYVLSAYGLFAACMAFSVYHAETYVANEDPRLRQPAWVKAMMGGVCVIMSGLGVVALSRTHNIVRKMTAFHSQHTYLRFEVRRLVPFMKPRTFDVLPSQVSFRRRLVVSPQGAARYQRDSMKVGRADQPQKSVFKAPIEGLSRVCWGAFMSVRQLFTQEDFILLEIDGKGIFRVDSNGVLTEDFLALGNPVKFTDH
ncbi:uncharacterized protein N7477_007007 [Penicillium maclennaniae]|uniref:uncharacterized protein n=1 Tax=Penicillium maclennaniae TaxID=1343394 RepID=UPI002540245B|nr:uncharacterized protein N7477_007007 [Penicillium maclennaniae]KAJ5668437.1 hypothetical protein N7477_007007 [Penicillium maclennaniae]